MAFFDSLFDWLSSSRATRRTTHHRHADRAFVPTETAAAAVVVLLADLDGRGGRELTTRLANLLSGHSGIDVFRRNRVLQLAPKGSLVDRLAAAAKTGREWLQAERAHVLVWGEADASVAGVTIRILQTVADAEGHGLGDTLELPSPFGGELEGVILATLLGAVGPTKEGARAPVAEMLGDVLDGVSGFIEAPPPSLDQTQLASVLTCLGNAFTASARMGADGRRLTRAVEAYHAALGKISKDDAPTTWALAQNHLATALQIKGDREADDASLEAAAACYRAVADALGQRAYPNDWALANFRLGTVLYKLATRSGPAKLLKDSGQAFERSIEVYTRDAMPGRWSDAMNHLGVVLMALGEELSGDAVLERAAAVFRSALEVRRRDLAPLLWAQTANNLGAACFALAKRNGRAEMLRGAAGCFEGAVDVYREHGQAQRVHVIIKNLQRVQSLLNTARGRR